MPPPVYSDPVYNSSSTDDGQVLAGAQAYAIDIWCYHEEQRNNIWGPLAAVIGTYGYIRQFELAERAADLAEDQVEIAQEYLALAQNSYNTITLPTFEKLDSCFDEHKARFSDFTFDLVTDILAEPEYIPDYQGEQARAEALVNAQFDKAIRRLRRRRGKYNSGQCCDEEKEFEIRRAVAISEARNQAYRFEQTLSFNRSDVRCQKRVQAIQLAEACSSRVQNGLLGGTNVNSQGLASIGSSISSLGSATGGAVAATAAQGSLFGQLGSGAFEFVGYQQGYNSVPQGYNLSGGSNPFGFNLNASNGFFQQQGTGVISTQPVLASQPQGVP